MDQKSQFPRRPETIFNDYKYDMPKSTKPVDGAKYPATWNWEIGLNGKIHIKINDGIYGQQDQNAKNKEVELNFLQRNQLLYVLEQAASDKDFESSQVLIQKKLFNRQTNRMNDTPSLQATFTIIRTKSGEIRVNFARGTYELMFIMNDDNLIIRSKGVDGTVNENPGLASRAYVMAFCSFSRRFLDNEEWTRYARAPKGGVAGAGGQGGQGGGNRFSGGGNSNNSGGGNGGGGNQAPKDFDDEIDMDF